MKTTRILTLYTVFETSDMADSGEWGPTTEVQSIRTKFDFVTPENQDIIVAAYKRSVSALGKPPKTQTFGLKTPKRIAAIRVEAVLTETTETIFVV